MKLYTDQAKGEFVPLNEGEVRIYSVARRYDYFHIGNAQLIILILLEGIWSIKDIK